MSFFGALDKFVNKIPEGIEHARATAIGQHDFPEMIMISLFHIVANAYLVSTC